MKRWMKRGTSLLLVLLMIMTTMLSGNSMVIAKADEEGTGTVSVSLSAEQRESLKTGEIHTVGVAAKNNTASTAILKIYLRNQDNSAATDIETPDFQTEGLDTEWKTDKDNNGNITSRYLQASLPAGAEANFNLELQYDLPDNATGSYEKKVNVEANAYVDDKDVTEAAADESKDNKVTVVWSGDADVTEISETMDGMAKLASSGSTALSVGDYLYLDISSFKEWANDGAKFAFYYLDNSDGEHYKTLQSYKDNLYRIQIPPDMDTSKIFIFVRCNPNGYQEEGSTFPSTKWNQTNDLFLSNAMSNTYKITRWDKSGEWAAQDTISSYAGKTICFENLGDSDLSQGVIAVFYRKDESMVEAANISMKKITDKRFSITIPSEECTYIQFKDTEGRILGDTYSNFYGQGEGESGVESFLYDEDSMYCYRYVSNADDSTWGGLGSVTVYFDATLSKLAYVSQGAPDNRIPSGDTISCNIWSTDSTKSSIEKTMTKVGSHTENGNTWSDVYKVEVPEGYNKILFYDGTSIPSNNTPKKTVDLTIPTNLNNPCFYADSSDDVIYRNNVSRSGYWDEVYAIRDPEKEGTVVDVTPGNLEKQRDQLYVSTTLYDYYTDFELNGMNRDTYDSSATINSHRIYQPFRQFDQALSQYYSDNYAASPLYWGNFQNYNGAHFDEISSTLNLFGSSEKNKFFYENNSMWGWDGKELTGNGGANATQGLVSPQLANGELQIKTSSGTPVLAPFFNQSFLEGNNVKNTVLGKVYNDVTFPFVKKAIRSGNGTVDYWYFDSADSSADNKNLQLRYSKDEGYFLQSTDKIVKGQTAGGSQTSAGNYFPFNTSFQSGKATQLNYGFGQKIEIDFRLTQDGTVKNTAQEVVPIEFNFSGDDDVWVFIDDKLVLDVGGGHAVVTGTINFKDKIAKVSCVKNPSGGGVTNNVEYNFSNLFGNDFYSTGHTLTMFYMERGLWESNMKITFNFPDENKFWVEKEVETPEVNSLFEDAVSTLSDLIFEFDIQNLATHEAEREAPTTTKTKTYNDTFAANEVSKYGSKVSDLQPNDTTHGKTAVRWKASGYRSSTDSQENTENRLISISPTGGRTFSAMDGSDSLTEYMTFDIYNSYDGNNTENGSSPFVALVDSSGHGIGAWAGNVGYKGASNKSGKQTWNTIFIDLSALKSKSVYGITEFDFTSIKEIRIGYWNNSSMYVSNIQFHKAATIQQLTGFTTAQKDIPSYGSVTSKTLMPATGAQYSLKTAGTVGTSKEVINNGTLYLKDDQTATFADQFRRGSYIYVSEKNVDPNVFDTKWTIYEKNSAVETNTLNKTTRTTEPKGTLVNTVTNVSGLNVNDGRKERTPQDTSITVPENAILFRSYSNPDDEVTVTNIGVKYVNTLKTGNLSITKAQVGDVFGNTDEFSFRITFTNVAGMNLEDNVNSGSDIVEEFTLKVGATKTFENIPAGTNYILEEVLEEDSEISVSSITRSEGSNDSFAQLSSSSVSGIIAADEGNQFDAITFSNTKNPTVAIQGEKIWKNADGTEKTDDLPEYIILKVQSKVVGSSDATYQDVCELDVDGKPTSNVLTTKVTADDNWKFSIENLPKYQSYDTSTGSGTGELQYKVVETQIKFANSDQPITIENGSGGGYQVTYDNGNVINTYIPESRIKITKVDATDENTKLANVEFKLEKYDENNKTWSEVLTRTTGNGENGSEKGILYFENLANGRYRLTETKAAEGYSLLKGPITIVINRPNGATIDGREYAENQITNNTIAITISNRAQFDLPATGGYGRYIVILGGLALAGLGLLMYRLQKRRKGGLNSQ